jgi:hypothetical protein
MASRLLRTLTIAGGLAGFAGSADAQMRLPVPQIPVIVEIQPEDVQDNGEDEVAVVLSGRSLDELIGDLDNPSFEVRRATTEELGTRTDFSLQDLEAQLDRNDLTPEQRLRIGAAAREHFGRGPRAAMGISWNQDFTNRASISGTIPGFDAHGKLKGGDVFVSVDGIPMRGLNSRRLFRWHLISHDPGDTLSVVVRRGKEKAHFDLVLGSFAALGEGREVPSRQDLAAAYRVRQQRLGRGGEGETFGLSAADWAAAREEGVKKFSMQVKARPGLVEPPNLVAGGAPRSGPDDDREDVRRNLGRVRSAQARNQFVATSIRTRLIDPMEVQPPRPRSIQNEIRDLETRVSMLRQQVKNADDESRRPGVGVVPNQNAAEIQESLQARLAVAEQTLESLKAEAEELGEPLEPDAKDNPVRQGAPVQRPAQTLPR